MIRGNKTKKTLLPLILATLFVAPASSAADRDYGPAPHSAAAKAVSCTQPNTAVREYAELIDRTRKNQPEIVEALRLFPKGGDIHNHLSGTVMAEDYIVMGTAEGDCYGPDGGNSAIYTLAIPSPSGCGSGFKPLASADSTDRTRIVESLSMYGFDYPDIQQGHDQFFATFGRFGAVSGSPCNTAPMLARLLRQAESDSVSYVETMVSFQSQAVNTLSRLLRKRFPDESSYLNSADYPALYDYLVDMGLNDAVAGAQSDIAMHVARTNAILGCNSAAREPACGVSFAFLAAVNRNSSQKDGSPDLAKIFTQTAFSVLLAEKERRVAGVNLVSGEDAAVSMGSFATQMQFFSFFHKAFPGVNIALHAGELTPCFVGAGNPALKDHLTGSMKAGAKRIGHGVSFAYLGDGDKAEVAALMKENDALVEIMFASNAQILGVAGDDHPFRQYAGYLVPMAFSTDDEGVSHADYTDEWIYGFVKYRLTWEDLEYLGRESLQHSFIPGAPLWSDVRTGKPASQCAGVTPGIPNPPAPCSSFLAASARAKAQWDYESRLAYYWQSHGVKYGKYLQRNSWVRGISEEIRVPTYYSQSNYSQPKARF